MSFEPLSRTAGAAAAAIAAGEVSSRELTEAVLHRIDVVDPRLNAVVELRAEQALEEAARADGAEADGPLHGVPITVKEAFNVAGLHTTWGNPAFKDYVADWDATVVSRLREAGAVIIGKTNAHFMLADFAQTFNDVYGRTNNPWNLKLTPGGSSGGSAAAVSAAETFLDFGSDLVGSIRIPAAFCGIYGLKPSVGVVPLTGLQPPGPPAAPSEMSYMSNVGPFGRAAGDLRTALTATGGPEISAFSWALPPARGSSLRDLRVGVVVADVSSDVGDVLSDAIDALASAGVRIVEGWPEEVKPAAVSEAFGYHLDLFFAFAEPDGSFERLPELVEYERRRMAVRAAWGRYFREADVFLCPVNFTPAFPHDPRPFEQRTVATADGERPYDAQPFWISHASLPGLPAVSAPVGRTARGCRHADHRPAVRGRHRDHVRRAGRRRRRRLRAAARVAFADNAGRRLTGPGSLNQSALHHVAGTTTSRWGQRLSQLTPHDTHANQAIAEARPGTGMALAADGGCRANPR